MNSRPQIRAVRKSEVGVLAGILCVIFTIFFIHNTHWSSCPANSVFLSSSLSFSYTTTHARVFPVRVHFRSSRLPPRFTRPDRHQQHSILLVSMDTPGIKLVRPMLVFGYDGKLAFARNWISYQNAAMKTQRFRVFCSKDGISPLA